MSRGCWSGEMILGATRVTVKDSYSAELPVYLLFAQHPGWIGGGGAEGWTGAGHDGYDDH
jgi:hypothetical protein